MDVVGNKVDGVRTSLVEMALGERDEERWPRTGALAVPSRRSRTGARAVVGTSVYPQDGEYSSVGLKK